MIRITCFAKKKKDNNSTSSSNNNSGFVKTIKTELETHLLWGNEFNGTQDIDGDLTSNGTITAENIISNNNVTANTINATTVNSQNGNITTVNSENVNTENLVADVGDIDFFTSLQATIDNAVIENLTVKKAHFWELIIDKMKSTNGTFILSPANCTIDKVIQMGTNLYRILWRVRDYDNNHEITNDFEINDQIICLTYNLDNNTNKYYWAKVLDKGTIQSYDDLTESENVFHYIIVGGAATNFDGDLNPEVGDNICTLGSTTETERQNAIIMSATNSNFIDTQCEAPSIIQYKGIKTFELDKYRLNTISPNNNVFWGDFKVINNGSYNDVKDLINESRNNMVTLSTDNLLTFIMANENSQISSLSAAVGLVNKIETYIGETIIPTSEYSTDTYIKWRNYTYYPLRNVPIEEYDGINIHDFTINTNDITINWSYQQDVSEDYTIAEDTQLEVYVKFTHETKTYEKNIKIPAKVIKTEKGTDAELDLLIVDTSTAIVTIEDKLQLNATAYVNHIKGTQVNRLTNLSEYTLKMKSNAGDEVTFTKDNDTFRYSNNNYINNYSTQTTKQTEYTITLYKNNMKVDEIVIPVIFESASIFQVKQDAITSAVAASKTYTDGEITTVNNSISQIEQTANAISQRVTNIEGDYITSSELSQTADNITLNIYDNFKNRTGIDVISGKIILDADTTEITGNLKLTSTRGNGLTIYDENNVERVNIQAKNITDIVDFDDDTYETKNFINNYTGTSYNNVIDTTNVGELFENTTVELSNIVLLVSADTSQFPQQEQANIKITLLKNDVVKHTENVIIYKQADNGRYLTNKRIKLPIKENGNYFITTEVTGFIDVLSSTTVHHILNCSLETGQRIETYIGMDGMFSHIGANKLFTINENEMKLQYGYSGIQMEREDDGMRGRINTIVGVTGTAPNIKPVWLPMENYVSYFNVNTVEYVYQQLTNDSFPFTKNGYAYNIDAQKDNGICIVRGKAWNGSSYVSSYVMLPYTFTQDGRTCELPTGYKMTIINNTGEGNVYVIPYATSARQSKIIKKNNDTVYLMEINKTVNLLYVGNKRWYEI